MRLCTRWIAPAALCGALLGFCTTGADALPGQTLVAFKTWSAHEKLLRGLSVTRDETSGWPAYRVTNSDHGIAWSFYALSAGKHIRSERLSVGSNATDSGEAIRQDGRGYGFAFWSALYGPILGRDLRASQPVFTVASRSNAAPVTYYRGRRFGYVLAGDLTIETLAVFADDVALAKKCAATPSSCGGE